jgi:hypothetical protein
MIHANEARELAGAGDLAVKSILNMLDKEIRKASSAGDRILDCAKLAQYSSVLTVCIPWFSHFTADKVQSRVMDELKKCGYTASYVEGSRYVPRGLQDDAGQGTIHKSISLVIKW